jgi:hypothetical protein
MTDREATMRTKLTRIERDIVVQKRLRRQRVYGHIDAADVSAEIDSLKKAAGRIRSHLNMGVYEHD